MTFAHEEIVEPLPTIHALGDDLLTLTKVDQVTSIVRPFLALFLCLFCLAQGWWLGFLAAAAVLQFLTYTSSSHDYAHRTLQLPRLLNEWLLALTEVVCLRSGHAFRATHFHHHRNFPASGDVEGWAAAQGFWRALFIGPGHQTRMFLWAWRHAGRRRPNDRRWMAGEFAAVVAVWFLAWSGSHPRLLIYCVVITLSNWLLPTATVWWPHRSEGATPLVHTKMVRGKWIPALFLQHTFHLEHHLYPMVASCRWQFLATRLEPYFVTRGVKPVVVP